VTWHRRDLFVTVEGIVQGSIFVDDANSARSSGYQIANLRLGSTGFFRGRRVGSSGFGYPWLSPVVGIQNLFDRRYVSSVSVNASGGKYYEPAPGRTLFVGLTVGDATGTPGAGAAP
jgi:iron complex outermembrane receptor protein